MLFLTSASLALGAGYCARLLVLLLRALAFVLLLLLFLDLKKTKSKPVGGLCACAGARQSTRPPECLTRVYAPVIKQLIKQQHAPDVVPRPGLSDVDVGGWDILISNGEVDEGPCCACCLQVPLGVRGLCTCPRSEHGGCYWRDVQRAVVLQRHWSVKYSAFARPPSTTTHATTYHHHSLRCIPYSQFITASTLLVVVVVGIWPLAWLELLTPTCPCDSQ